MGWNTVYVSSGAVAGSRRTFAWVDVDHLGSVSPPTCTPTDYFSLILILVPVQYPSLSETPDPLCQTQTVIFDLEDAPRSIRDL